MPNIKSVTDLRNYSEVLRDVAVDAPVFLTRNGRGKYVILDIREYDRLLAELKLFGELEKGRLSGERKGWIDAAEVFKHLEDSHE